MNPQQMPPNLAQGNAPTSMTNVMNRPASAYFNNSNSSNVMNLSSPSTPNIPNSTSQQPQNTSSMGNLMQQQQAQASMMPYNAHISHPNLSGMSNASSSITNSPITAHRPPMIPNKQQQQQLRMGGQQQMMAPSMPNIAHASGYASNIPASQSMQNVNVFPMYQQHDMQPQQISPSQQASLLRGSAKMAEMSEMIKRQQQSSNQQRPSNGPIHFTNSMDNIHIPPPMLSPGAHPRSSAAQVFHPQSPQKSHAPPNTAPKPQVDCTFFY